MWAEVSFVLSQFTRLTDGRTDRHTDGLLIARPQLRHDKNLVKRLATFQLTFLITDCDVII